MEDAFDWYWDAARRGWKKERLGSGLSIDVPFRPAFGAIPSEETEGRRMAFGEMVRTEDVLARLRDAFKTELFKRTLNNQAPEIREKWQRRYPQE